MLKINRYIHRKIGRKIEKEDSYGRTMPDEVLWVNVVLNKYVSIMSEALGFRDLSLDMVKDLLINIIRKRVVAE